MRRARVLLFLLLIAGGAAAYFAANNDLELPPVPGAGTSTPGKPAGKQATTADPARPTFDVVRAEPTGDLVMAGRAEPGWAVTVESNGRVVGSAVADPNGEWIIQPSGPVGKGEHSLQLKSQSPKGGQTLFSKQRLALSLGEGAKTRPLVALTEEGEATRVLQMSPPAADAQRSAALASAETGNLQSPPIKPETTTARALPPQVSFTSVDYEHSDGRSTVFLTGRGTPGARLMLYIDDQYTGVTTVDATGGWTFKSLRELAGGSHVLRADSINLFDNSKVLARAEVNFERQVPKTATAAASGPVPSGVPAGAPPGRVEIGAHTSPPPEPGQSSPAPQRTAEAPSSAGTPWNAAENTPETTGAKPDTGVIIIRRGDTLWQIAERHYGSGARYTQIFQNNRDQIRNPNRIYPNQRFTVPR